MKQENSHTFFSCDLTLVPLTLIYELVNSVKFLQTDRRKVHFVDR